MSVQLCDVDMHSTRIRHSFDITQLYTHSTTVHSFDNCTLIRHHTTVQSFDNCSPIIYEFVTPLQWGKKGIIIPWKNVEVFGIYRIDEVMEIMKSKFGDAQILSMEKRDQSQVDV